MNTQDLNKSITTALFLRVKNWKPSKRPGTGKYDMVRSYSGDCAANEGKNEKVLCVLIQDEGNGKHAARNFSLYSLSTSELSQLVYLLNKM